MLLCVWPALNPLSIHVTFTAVVPGAYRGEAKICLRLIAECDERSVGDSHPSCSGCWRNSAKPLQYYCHTLPLPYLHDQSKSLFWRKMHESENCFLYTLSRVVRYHFMVVGSIAYMVSSCWNHICLTDYYRGWYVVVHLYSNFSIRRQMAPVHHRVSNFKPRIFRFSAHVLLWFSEQRCEVRGVFCHVIMGNATHILPVLQWLEVVIAFVSSLICHVGLGTTARLWHRRLQSVRQLSRVHGTDVIWY